SLLCYRITDHGVNLGGGVRLHSRHDMQIQVKRDPDSRMAEPFTGNLRMDASGQQLCGVGMPEVVETHAGKIETPYQILPCIGEGTRLKRLALVIGNNEVIIGQAYSE